MATETSQFLFRDFSPEAKTLAREWMLEQSDRPDLVPKMDGAESYLGYLGFQIRVSDESGAIHAFCGGILLEPTLAWKVKDAVGSDWVSDTRVSVELVERATGFLVWNA